MSWDADLIDDANGGALIEVNYTHNISVMIYAVLTDAGIDLAARESWWQRLNGLPGPEGAGYLDVIIRGLEADPDRFRAMNPSNGWGDYEGLVKHLTDMRNAVPEWPCHWEACG